MYVWIALPFQFANRLSSLLSVDVPGFVWRASKKSSGGAKISSFWLKKSIPPPPTSLKPWRAVCTAWKDAVSPPVKRSTVSPVLPTAVVCSGFEPK